jgi:hypothetical protein
MPMTTTPSGGPSPAPTPPSYSQIMQNLISSMNAPSQASMLGGMFGNNNIVKGFAGMMDQANKANAQRGQSILQLLQGQGTAQMQRNQQDYQSQLAGIDQSMMDKGLSNLTVGDNLKQTAQDQLYQANQQVSENSALNLANMANSFNQQGPSLDTLANLMARGGGQPAQQTGTWITDWNGNTRKVA